MSDSDQYRKKEEILIQYKRELLEHINSEHKLIFVSSFWEAL